MRRSNIYLILFVIMAGQIIGAFSTEGIYSTVQPSTVKGIISWFP